MSRLTLGRKGISPLVATILLLAFAVAIGTMVVAYLLDTFQARPCDDVSLKIDGADHACYANGRTVFTITNTGEHTVTGIVLRLTTLNGEIKEYRLEDEILPASASRIDVPFETIDPASVEIVLTPRIMHKDQEKFCTDAQTQVKLQYC